VSRVGNPASRNHYLPQFYLRQFCDRSGRVFRTFRGTDDALHEKRFVPKATGYERHLYSLVDAGLLFPAKQPDQIEREVFGPIDDRGSVALDRLLHSAPSQLTGDEKGHWAAFVNSLLQRHPQRIRERDRVAEKMARKRLGALRKHFGPPPPGRPDIFEQFDVEALARNMHRGHIVKEVQNQRSIDYLGGFTLVKIRFETSPVLAFVTGDDPVLVNAGRPWPVRYFTFALSPETLLLGHSFSETLDTETLFGLALIHNLELFAQCEYVFSRHPLVDGEYVSTRKAAQISLKPVPWRKN